MLDVCLLGSGGMMPLPYRFLTSLMTRFNGSSLMIDCGEGTQVALKEKGYNPVNQIVGYIMSGDPTYITSHNNARSLIMKVERDELVEEVIRYFIAGKGL